MKKIVQFLKAGKRIALLWAALFLAAQGCNKEEGSEHKHVNDWILDNMREVYLWNAHMQRKTNKNLYPSEYFGSLLHREEDRFSWIQDDFLELMKYLSGVTTEAGYEFYLFRTSEASDLVFGYIAYVKPETPAATVGLKRGDIFSEIDNVAMTMSNYQGLLRRISQPHSVTLPENNATVWLSVLEYKENPIFLDTIYHIGGKKIGYLVYNFFARDSEPNGIAYEKQLNDVFGNFISASIDELIIDLRYNSGGAVTTTQALASMVSGKGKDDVFGYQIYNSIVSGYFERRYGKDFNKSFFFDEIVRYANNQPIESVPINKLENLDRLHLIVSRHTASASELLINCLRPYMNVTLIGEKTVGKNIGSITIYEEDEEKQKTNRWGMQPIVSKFENSDNFSGYRDGFAPDVPATDFRLNEKMRQLGDTDELMLSAALRYIGGAATPQRSGESLQTEIVGASFDRNPMKKHMIVK